MTGRIARLVNDLRDRNFRLLWAGETISMVGSAVTVVALPLVAITLLDASPTALGVLTACAWLPMPTLALFAGAWVDQVGRRRTLIAANAASAAVFATVPVAAWLGVLTMWQLIAVALAGGVARVFLRVTFSAYVPLVVPRERLTSANAWIGFSESGSEVAGPGLAGLLAQAFGAATAVLLDAVSFLAAAVCLGRIRAVEVARRSNEGLRKRIVDGIRYTFSDRWLRTIAVFVAMTNGAQAAMQALLVLFLVSTVGVSAATAGLLMVGMGVGGVLGAAVVTPIAARYGTARTMLWAEIASVPFALLIPATETGSRLALFAVGLVGVFAGVTAGSVIARSWRQSYVPDDMLARSGATMTVFGFGAIPAGAVAGGWLASTIGVRPALWVVCAAMLVPMFVLLLSPIRGRRDLPAASTLQEDPR